MSVVRGAQRRTGGERGLIRLRSILLGMFLWRGEIGSMTEEVESEFFRSWPLAAEFEMLLPPPHTQKCVGAHVLHVC